MDKHSYLSNTSISELELLYQQYLSNPESIDPSWQKFFEGFEFARANYQTKQESEFVSNEFKVINLINAYRERGHLFTKTNPVRARRNYQPTLDYVNFDLSESDLQIEFHAGAKLGLGKARLNEIIKTLQQTYCQSIGVEYRYIRNVEMRDWLRDKMETQRNTPNFNTEDKIHILEKLSEAVLFENFIHKKFPGQKRFSLEGGEALIPALDSIIEVGANNGAIEFVLGMAHRGRLNVLGNILQKPYQEIFSEFEGKEYDDVQLMGDVKYHLGYTSTRSLKNGKKIRLTLSPNPSHLETVNPVVEGIVRARLDHICEKDFNKMVPILIHGDAAVAGQGIVYEVLQMSGLPAYHTGGTIHIVINNQIGFTTNYLEARTSTYCTDVAKTIQVPIFHVNGDDIEAMVYTTRLAMEFRQRFHKDVFIDLLCYRKYGHNEGDEPRFTQPVLYKIIEKHLNPLKIYASKLIEEGAISQEQASKIENDINNIFESNLSQAKQIEKSSITSFLSTEWKHIRKAQPEDFQYSPETGVSLDIIKEITEKICHIPEDKKVFRKLVKIWEERKAMIFETEKLDWGMAELLAYSTLLKEGYPIRFSGQDVERGTFSHRHAVLTIEDSEEKYYPLRQISKDQGEFEIYNSLLSEYGVLGFEYGYAMASPETLTIWEAQFGDFFNGAQIIFDQYLSSAEEKWNVMNGMVILLPHGYEGQGPEHSSARMERFLTLCADLNMQVANCTTPANFYHLLRRQMKRDFRKPLIVFTPKSLLRHPACVSNVSEITQGCFRELIDDNGLENIETVKKLLFCTGKVYYDLIAERERLQDKGTAIIRLEQIYPLPENQINEIIKKYNQAEDYVWVQEEPLNMGSWIFISRNLKLKNLRVVARPATGTPATGSPSLHKIRSKKILEKAFGMCTCNEAKEECRMRCTTEEWN